MTGLNTNFTDPIYISIIFFFIPAKVTRSQNTDLIDTRLNPYTSKLGEKYLYAQEREPKYGQID